VELFAHPFSSYCQKAEARYFRPYFPGGALGRD